MAPQRRRRGRRAPRGRRRRRQGATAPPHPRPPAPGQLIDVGGHDLHVIPAGHGPTVVFENGLGGMALDWAHVQPRIARQTGTFAHDWAGIAWSDPGPRPRDIKTLVDELHRALHAADAPAPHVLVGHSFGGLVVRAFAYTHPTRSPGWSCSTRLTRTGWR